MKIILKKQYQEIINKLHENGAHCYIVGGYIRDLLLKKESTDIDVEVFNISKNKLKNILKDYDEFQEFNKYGVYKVGKEISFSIPRKDKKNNQKGYHGFDVEFIPNASIKEALQRRDLTINAIYYNLKTNELIDIVGGINDIEKRILKAINSSFVEDPMRLLRIMRFACKYDFEIDLQTLNYCRSMNFNDATKSKRDHFLSFLNSEEIYKMRLIEKNLNNFL